MSLLPICPRCGHPEHDGGCLFPRTEVVLALDSKDSEIESLRAQAKATEERATELESLFDAQQAPVEEATRRWQKATGNHGVLPDLGRLVQWLMDRADEAESR